MSSKSFKAPRRFADDHREMTVAVDWLEANLPNACWHRPHVAHLKVGCVNYWPGTGTLQLDSKKGEKLQPLSAFQRQVREHLPHHFESDDD